MRITKIKVKEMKSMPTENEFSRIHRLFLILRNKVSRFSK